MFKIEKQPKNCVQSTPKIMASIQCLGCPFPLHVHRIQDSAGKNGKKWGTGFLGSKICTKAGHFHAITTQKGCNSTQTPQCIIYLQSLCALQGAPEALYAKPTHWLAPAPERLSAAAGCVLPWLVSCWCFGFWMGIRALLWQCLNALRPQLKDTPGQTSVFSHPPLDKQKHTPYGKSVNAAPLEHSLDKTQITGAAADCCMLL